MQKTMYIPRGQERNFDSLTCENIIVNGSLRVDGEIRAKHIQGKGFICANVISAGTVTVNIIDAGTIITDELLAERVAAVEIHAARSITASCYLEAELVVTAKITMTDATISELNADEVVDLKPKRRSLLGTLFASFIRATWTGFWYNKHPTDASQTEKTLQSAVTCADTAAGRIEAEQIINDPDFWCIRSLYQLSKEKGLALQLVPSKTQEDLSGALPAPAFTTSPFDEEEIVIKEAA